MRFQKIDFLWLLAFPVYQTIGTIRHEGSHALAAILQGAEIKKFVFWPSFINDRFYWGYVRWNEATNWLTTATPYFCDLITFILFYLVCTKLRIKRRWIWVNLVIIGMISPFANSAYAYIRGLMGSVNDFAKLTYEIPSWVVHAYFLITLAVYVTVLYFFFRPRHS